MLSHLNCETMTCWWRYDGWLDFLSWIIMIFIYLQEYPIPYDWKNLKLQYRRKDAIEGIRKMSNYYFSNQRFYIQVLNHMKYVHTGNFPTRIDSKYCDYYKTCSFYKTRTSTRTNNQIQWCQNRCFMQIQHLPRLNWNIKRHLHTNVI